MHRENESLAQGNTALKSGQLGVKQGRLASKLLDRARRAHLLAARYGFLSALLLLGELGAEGQHSMVSGT